MRVVETEVVKETLNEETEPMRPTANFASCSGGPHHVVTNAGTITYSDAVLAPLIVAADLGLASWGWGLHAGHAEQESQLTKHDGEIATLQWDSDRILAKLDEILRVRNGRTRNASGQRPAKV